MIVLTEKAGSELKNVFQGDEQRAVRVYLVPGGYTGPMLVLSLDTPTEEDLVEEKGGITFCMAKPLQQQVRNVTIDFGNMGFICTPEIPLPSSAAGTCSGSCKSCGGSCH